ncbi:hypothetical protein [Alteraurantiacibacter aquimixticola]|nr:hypothetical protein [Alteraurantiacibacter aquimixticola]
MTEAWQSALACIQSLGRRGHEIHVLVGNDPELLNAKSSWVKGVTRFPRSMKAEGDAKALLDFVEERGFDIVIPISDYDAEIAAVAREHPQLGERFVSSSSDAIAVARSRNRTVELARKLGIGVPPTEFVTRETAAKALEKLGFPAYLKASSSTGSFGVQRLSTMDQLEQALAKLPEDAEIQVQQEVTGVSHGVTGFCRHGEVLGSFAFRHAYKTNLGGAQAHLLLADEPQLHDILGKVARELDWHGGIDLDLIVSPEHGPVLLEINPRLSGTAVFALKRGVDLPAGYLPTSTSPEDLQAAPLNPNATGFINIPREMILLQAGGKKMREIALGFRRQHKCADSWFANDPGYSRALFNAVQVGWLRQG